MAVSRRINEMLFLTWREQVSQNHSFDLAVIVRMTLMVFASVMSTLSHASTATEVFRLARDSVVEIRTDRGSFGSGFFFGDGSYIATNQHVIRGATAIRVITSDGIEFRVSRVVKQGFMLDLAILEVPVKGKPLRLARKEADIGNDVFAIGTPQGYASTLSAGIISANRLDKSLELIQFTAPISPGSSGGPLLNHVGEVVGVVTMYFTGGQNLNFAVAIKHLSELRDREPPPSLANTQNLDQPSRSEHVTGLLGVTNPEVLVTRVELIGSSSRRSGARVELLNLSKCDVEGVEGYMEFVERPMRSAPVVYQHVFQLNETWTPNERRTVWIEIDAVRGRGADAPVEDRLYPRTRITNIVSACD